ncbi:MAG: hypothetical protein ACAI38_03155 [Myxococcota bacterium]
MSDVPQGDDPLATVRARIDELLNIDVPLMVSRGQLNDEQLFETIGILSMWMRAVMGEVDGQTTEIIGQFMQAIESAYAEDPRPFSQKVHGHLEAALRDNPALVRLRTHLEEALAAVPDDPQVGASRAFLVYATRPTCDPEVMAYFEILLGLR